ncbi:MAG: LysM peptidoglycan-binding domain-containing protein [Opitutaceae bacterium]|nr:LysM peptidoglycan-binding domain-containing protein [Opitutaceae bacterium]
MKILQIFGAVVALHLLAFLFIFASPGCQSNPRNVPTPDSTVPSATSASTVNYASTPVDLSTGGGAAGSPITYSPSYAPGRAAPTRPGSPAAAAVTPSKPVVEDVAPVSTYTVVKGDSLWTIAKKNGLTVSELAKTNNLSAGSTLQPGKKLIIPGRPGLAAAAYGPVAATGEGQTYKVVSGDSLSSIAKRHGTTVTALKAANNLTSDLVQTGQELRLPVGAKATAEYTAASAASTFTASPRAQGEALEHVVLPGEKLATIARKYQITVGELATANNITDPAKIRAGQKLIIPGFKPVGSKQAVESTPPPAAPAAPTVTPAPSSAPRFEITPPPPGQDLDSGLKETGTDVPTIKIEEPKDPSSPSQSI